MMGYDYNGLRSELIINTFVKNVHNWPIFHYNTEMKCAVVISLSIV